MEENKYKIGTVVSLKSNGLLPLAEHHFLSLGGNENFVTPLMVIIEILFNTSSPEIDEETGEPKSTNKSGNKYKCMYFSNKTMKFEENWFTEKELSFYGNWDYKIYKKIELEFKWGDIVRFKTVDEEARKTKSFSINENKKGAKSLLTFTAPAMQIVGYTKIDNKEPLIDSITGLKKREKSEKLVKCKFFNVDSDKFSEQLIPIECLQKIDNSNLKERLNSISSYISKKSLVIIETDRTNFFGKPQSVHVCSGRYQLEYYNELLKKNELIWMDEIQTFDEINFSNGEYYPSINPFTNKIESIHDLIENTLKNLIGNHFKIIYRNLKEERVSRYITLKQLTNEPKNENNDDNLVFYYLKSYCHLREADRDFRSDRILSIRTITDEKLNDFLTNKQLSK